MIIRCHYNIGIAKFSTKEGSSKHKPVIKTIENGIIAYNNETQEIEFYPWDEVSRITYPYKPKHMLGLFIQFTQYCDEVDKRLRSSYL